MTFSDLVPSREIVDRGKTGFEPSRTKFRCSDGYGLQPVMSISFVLESIDFQAGTKLLPVPGMIECQFFKQGLIIIRYCFGL